MVNPNRVHIVPILGLALIVCGISFLEGDKVEAAVIALMLASLAVALTGKGGRALYWAAMLVSCLLVAYLPLFGFDMYMHANQVPPYDSAQPYDWTMGSLFLLIGLTGLACYHCISRTHPSVNQDALDRELNALNVGLVSGILFGLLANMLLIAFFVDGVWTFVEIIWIFWFESLVISAFATWNIVKADRLDPRGTRYEHHSPEGIRRQVLTNSLRVSAAFYAIYLAIVTWFLGPPHVEHIGPLLLVMGALATSRFVEADQKNRGFNNRGLKLKGMTRAHTWRLVALHIGLLLAALSLIGGSEGAAALFLFIKAGFDVIVAIVSYRYFRAVALESFPRLRIERRRRGSRRRH